MKRRGPRKGYNTGLGTKKQYRRDIWGKFSRYFERETKDKVALLMPSIEGDEVTEARSRGFRELHVVDDNPAIVATLQKRFPGITTYGVDLLRALQRMKDDGVTLHCANLDLTGPVSTRLGAILKAVAWSGVFAHGAVIAVTVLRGRESKATVVWKDGKPISLEDFGREMLARMAGSPNAEGISHYTKKFDLTAMDWGRLFYPPLMWAGSPYVTYGLETAKYRSPNGIHSMLWMMYSLHREPCPCRRCVLRPRIIHDEDIVRFNPNSVSNLKFARGSFTCQPPS